MVSESEFINERDIQWIYMKDQHFTQWWQFRKTTLQGFEVPKNDTARLASHITVGKTIQNSLHIALLSN
jgi:hypothetical protein